MSFTFERPASEGAETVTMQSTRFGSSFSSPVTAAGVLRAFASRMGAELSDCDPVDLVASAIAADAWMMVLQAERLGDPSVLDSTSASAFSNLLMRAAGVRNTHSGPPVEWAPSHEPHHLAAVESYRAWAVEVLGDQADDALLRAAADLAVPGRLGALSALLAIA